MFRSTRIFFTILFVLPLVVMRERIRQWLAVLLAAAFYVAPSVAFAQAGAPADAPALGWPVIVAAVIGAALSALAILAPRTKNTVDDTALAFLKEAEPTLRKWLDPSDPTVPPSPDGKA